MPFPNIVPQLKSQMPELRGGLTDNLPLAPFTSFKVGGPAQVFFVPQDESDLCYFLSRLPAEIPVSALGRGSNILIRDGGVRGVVVHLKQTFAQMRIDNLDLAVGAAASNGRVAGKAYAAGIAGLSFLCGIPGGIGGALRMNCGGYGSEIKNVFVEARAIDRQGRLHTLTKDNVRFAYRHCSAPQDYIFTHAVLRGARGDQREIRADMIRIQKYRQENHPLNRPTCGSTFKNPDGSSAWRLIAAAGCRGLTIGDAQVSTKHPNFFVNLGGATAGDIEDLGQAVRVRVKNHSGVELEWEVRRVGERPADL